MIRAVLPLTTLAILTTWSCPSGADAVADCKAGNYAALSGIERQACLMGDYEQVRAFEQTGKAMNPSSDDDEDCPQGTMYGGTNPKTGKTTTAKAAC